jgi:hypothetical protein
VGADRLKAAFWFVLDLVFRPASLATLVAIAFITTAFLLFNGEVSKALVVMAFGAAGLILWLSFLFFAEKIGASTALHLERRFPALFDLVRHPRNADFIDTSVRTEPNNNLKPDA